MRVFCKFTDIKHIVPIICFEVDSSYFHFPQLKEIIELGNCTYSIFNIVNVFNAENISNINQTIEYHLKRI